MLKKVVGLVLSGMIFFNTCIGVMAEEQKQTLNFQEEKIGIAFAGGGLLGSYQLGAMRYLREQGVEITDFDSAIGSSVGSVVLGGLLSQGLDRTTDMMLNLTSENVYVGKLTSTNCKYYESQLNKMYTAGNNVGTFALLGRGLVKGPLDNTPMKDLIKSNVNENKILNSGVEVGFCVNSTKSILKPMCKSGVELNGNTSDWIIASASCWPVFDAHKVNGKAYIDGAYLDRANSDFLFTQFNCDKIVVLNLMTGSESENSENVISINPSCDLGSFLDFNPEHILRNYRQGYNDCKNYFENNVDIIK